MMNRTRFRLLVFFMSLSLLGIILVQLNWVSLSLKSSSEQFKYHVSQIIKGVTEKMESDERLEFNKLYHKIQDSVGRVPEKRDFINYLSRDISKKELDSIYNDSVNDYKEFLDINEGNNNFNSQIPDNGMTIDGILRQNKADKKEIEDRNKLYFDFLYKFFNDKRPIEKRVSNEGLKNTLSESLRSAGVETPFEYAILNMGLATKIESPNFSYNRDISLDAHIFSNNERNTRYRLVVSFPHKEKFLFSSLLGITSLSIVFTLIIIIAYLSAINQLIKQKQISEIKTDFINNMTHEFKTPIATINLALDAIRNPKIFDDSEKVQRYLQMIREENKRMHSQVENVLQISKLDKRELDIPKGAADIHDVIEEAIAHVHLIIEDRQGKLTRHFHAQRTTALLNDVHFTNVLVNILDNAIKYSPDEPIIDIYTENIKDFILIKIADKGLGMSKNTQKRIFEKFYREHTGDIHNVKGHGLGLAYVKRIIDDHNCHIYVESEKGKGSTFIIKMPLIN